MQANDGIFWMTWEDFQNHFYSIYVCRTYEPDMRHTIKGEWKGDSAAGWCMHPGWHKNPQILLKSDDLSPMSVFMTLTQGPHRRIVQSEGCGGNTPRAEKYYTIGFHVLKRGGKRTSIAPSICESETRECTYVDSREVAFELELEHYAPGYTIVPTTKHRGEEGTFMLSVFTKHNVKLTWAPPV